MTHAEFAATVVEEYLAACGFNCSRSFSGNRISEIIGTKGDDKWGVIVIPQVAYEFYDNSEAINADRLRWAKELYDRMDVAKALSFPFDLAFVEMTEDCEQIGEIKWTPNF